MGELERRAVPTIAASVPAPSTAPVLESQISAQQAADSIHADGPTVMKSSLGTMQVYPDDYAGPLPPGAVTASNHARMLSVIDGISAGTSSISIDTANFMSGKDPVEDPVGHAHAMQAAQEFRDQYMGYMTDLVKVPTGLTMLEELSGSKHKTKIEKGRINRTLDEHPENALVNDDGTRNVGTGSTVQVNPDLVSFKDPGVMEEDWMTERQRYGFYHELVHAYHDGRGDTAKGSHKRVPNYEWQTVGLGNFQGEAISDNTIRGEFGKQLRPDYSGETW